MGQMLAMGRSHDGAYIEQSQMGSTSFGGDDLVTMITTRPPDEIEIDRGTVAAWVLLATFS